MAVWSYRRDARSSDPKLGSTGPVEQHCATRTPGGRWGTRYAQRSWASASAVGCKPYQAAFASSLARGFPSLLLGYRLHQEREGLLEPLGADRAALVVSEAHHDEVVRRDDQRRLCLCGDVLVS